MKINTKEDLIEYRLSRSRETLQEVYEIKKLGYYNTAINRLYYASFYAVLALLLKFDVLTKTHSGVRQMFGLHFISKKLISNISGKTYTELFDKRQKGDYNDFFDFNENDVIDLLKPTENLISEIELLIDKGPQIQRI